MLRRDQGLERLLGRKVMAPSTAHDFLRRLRYDGLSGLGEARRRMLTRLAEQTNTTTATLDCDASLFTSTGKNARMSYKGARGYMPMLAFWEELGTVVHDDFRNGNASPGSDALAFLQASLAQLPGAVEAINVRSDSAWYRKRGQCENQIKELKWDFETRVLPSGDFFINALYLRIMTLAYNLFIALKTLALPEPYRSLRLKTLLFRLLGVPALITRHARRLWLKLPRGHPHLDIFKIATH